jgi:hypothetical protein
MVAMCWRREDSLPPLTVDSTILYSAEGGRKKREDTMSRP